MNLRKHGKRAWGSNALLLGALVAGFATQGLSAQEASDPSLHTRSAARPDSTPVPVVATGHSDLPPEAEGEYPWDKLGGEIEVYFEGGKLHGYMTDHLDPDQHASPATLDFATTHTDGHAISFTTRTVHDLSFSFSGHLERGMVQSPQQPGFYVLTGTLTQHGGQAGEVTRTVSLKREPGTP